MARWLIAILVFIGYSMHFRNIWTSRWNRLFWHHGAPMRGYTGGIGYYPPDIELHHWTHDYLGYDRRDDPDGVISVPCLVVMIAIPAGLVFASYNLTPQPPYSCYPVGATCSSMACRAVHETIWTILFVSILGFGMLAGRQLALTLFSASASPCKLIV